MNNKPVAWMETYKGEPNNLDWDKSNLNYGSEFHDVVPLYTHPVSQYKAITNTKIEPTVVSYTHPVKEHDIGISHAIGFDDGFKAGMQRAVEMNVVKELTDEEIIACIDEIEPDTADMIRFARAILRKAQEK